MRRLIFVVALAAVLTTGTRAAWACTRCPQTGGAATDSGGEVVVGVSAESGGQAGNSGDKDGSGQGPANPIVCTVYEGVADTGENGDIGTELDTSTIADGTVVWETCSDSVTGEYVYSGQFTWGGGQPLPYVPPEVLAQQAKAQLVLPSPFVQTWPAPNSQLVNLPTWLHVNNFSRYERTAAVGGVSATVYAEPVRVDWTMGDGGRVSCSSAGMVFTSGVADPSASSDCSYAFTRTSADAPGHAFQGSVSISWHLRWDSSVGAAGDLGTVVMTTAVAWQVEQIQSIITHEGRPS